MAPGRGFARRFIAGETIEEALGAVSDFHARGLRLTMDYLGESVSSADAAKSASDEYLRILDAMVRAGIERNVSVKLTQLGLDVDRATAVDNMRRILEHGAPHDFFVRIDMEGSPILRSTRGRRRAVAAAVSQLRRGRFSRASSDPKATSAAQPVGRFACGWSGRVPGTQDLGLPGQGDGGRHVRRVDAPAARLRRLSAIATHDPAMIEATKCTLARKGPATIASSSRCCTASGATCRRRWSPKAIGPHLRTVRQAVVPLLHAPSGRAAGEHRLRLESNARGKTERRTRSDFTFRLRRDRLRQRGTELTIRSRVPLHHPLFKSTRTEVTPKAQKHGVYPSHYRDSRFSVARDSLLSWR